jgi:hypothetical protein
MGSIDPLSGVDEVVKVVSPYLHRRLSVPRARFESTRGCLESIQKVCLDVLASLDRDDPLEVVATMIPDESVREPWRAVLSRAQTDRYVPRRMRNAIGLLGAGLDGMASWIAMARVGEAQVHGESTEQLEQVMVTELEASLRSLRRLGPRHVRPLAEPGDATSTERTSSMRREMVRSLLAQGAEQNADLARYLVEDLDRRVRWRPTTDD